ncbi:MAG: 50S ribosome-binding GTPase [Gammaproteobacteria bacterium]|nr:50S ribosome-binding GTPase [Gammaproteobacteria bacterium]
MKLPRSLRVLIALGVVVLCLAALLLVLVISEATLNIQARLDEAPAWLGYAWWGLLAAIGVGGGWFTWRILRPRGKRERIAQPDEPPSREQLDEQIEKAKALGVDIAEIERELAELSRRREAGEIHVALFGEISTGKSALITALLPDAEARSDVRGGTTRELARYTWRSRGGDTMLLTDMPGTAEADGDLDQLAIDEATRAHIVVYVTDGDINRAQHGALSALMALHKPLVLVLNKSDQYTDDQLGLLNAKLEKLVAGQANASFVSVSAATTRKVVVKRPDGSETFETRDVAPRVEKLARALQRLVDGNQDLLDRLSDSATFVLAARQLDTAVAANRRRKADKLVDAYAAKAVVGAMAAIAPGSDLLIQGYLGTQLVRELAELYDTKVAKFDTELLLKLVQQHAAKAHTLLLAVAGNALKAFPGIGTLAGGAMHAVAYGIIFRTLGRALTITLESRGELHPRQTARLFEERLGGNLETSARSLAGVVAEQLRKSNDRTPS